MNKHNMDYYFSEEFIEEYRLREVTCCNYIMYEQWRKLVGIRIPVHFESYMFCRGKINTCELDIDINTVEELAEGEWELEDPMPSNMLIPDFIQDLKEKVRKGSVSISIRAWEEVDHCFILVWKEESYYIIDSYIYVRELEERLFLFEEFQKFLETSSVKQYNKLFNVNEDSRLVKGSISLVIAYK